MRRYGAIRLSQVALIVGAAGLTLLTTASVWLGLFGAALIGIGYGPMTPASSHILIHRAPPSRRALIFSIKQTGVPLGGALAGLVVPLLALHLAWRGAALVVAAAAVALAAINLVMGQPALRRLALASLAYSAMQL